MRSPSSATRPQPTLPRATSPFSLTQSRWIGRASLVKTRATKLRLQSRTNRERGELRLPPLSVGRSEEHTPELQSHSDLACRLLLAETNITHVHERADDQRC